MHKILELNLVHHTGSCATIHVTELVSAKMRQTPQVARLCINNLNYTYLMTFICDMLESYELI